MTPFVEAHDLVLGYDGNVAVTASSFAIPVGGVTAIIGPNGSGKSTALHAVAGILTPISGTLRVFGQPPSDAWRRCAYVMQTVHFPPGVPITAKEVVGMGRYPTRGWFRPFRNDDHARIADAMEQLEITDLAGKHLSELSGGQRQRVYVAQALAQDHEAVLMDEPLTGLDIVSAKTIDRIIHTENEVGHSVILTTHDLDEARAADTVILMSGRVVAHGTPESVLTRENLEIAYGLGALHEWDDSTFLDDPADTGHHHSAQ
ncbi:MAG TPA: metal ABC transporter ATP-binding protein [Actinomycetaceae bacterium]|nr:metal ABC transporter ATP-binding protein [Actinomycetaceae bacterium]